MHSGHRVGESIEDRKKPLHPAWTAVGCFLIIGFMTLGYFLADWFLQENAKNLWILIPAEFAWPDFAPFLSFKLVVGVMISMIGTALTSILYSIFNPPKPGKYDVIKPEDLPPVYTKHKR